MTHTDPTAAGLLAGVLARPECDTARLVYADRLTEIAGPPRECPRCVGWSLRADMQISGSWPCPTCQGTGTVSDGFAERAEFVRAQVAIARIDRGETWGSDKDEYRRAEKAQRKLTPERRREWFGITCPECGGTGRDRGDVYDRGMVGVCRACNGTRLAPVEVLRGFVESVRCRMGDVMRERYEQCPECEQLVRHRRGRPGGAAQPRCGKCDGGARRAWTLTPWAAGVLKAHPVVRWEIVDREPARLGDKYGWWENGADEPLIIGRVLWPEMYVPGGTRREWDDSPELARDALARAVGRVARRLAGLPDFTPVAE